MRILVIGAGATGGFYGGKLALAGRDVTFLVRERRAAELRTKGLVLRTPGGEQSLVPKLIDGASLKAAGPFDLILLSVKDYALAEAIEDFAPAVGPETMILPVLNGMRHLDTLDARFGGKAVLGGLCRIMGTLDDDGRVVQMTPLNQLAYGERDRSRSARIVAVDETLQGAGFDATLSDDILAFMWFKWMLLSSVNTINVLGRGSVGELEAVQELEGVGRRVEARVLSEAIAVATAHGYPPSEEHLHILTRTLTAPGSSFESSMYRDYTAGYRVESWQILGDMVARGRTKNVDTPLIEAAFVQLRVYERAKGFA